MRYIAFALLALTLLFIDESPRFGAAADTPAQQTKAKQMMRLVASSAVFQKLPQECPLAIYRSKAKVSGPAVDCSANPRRCMRQCEAGNRKACFGAARVIQKGDDNIPNSNRATYRLFMEGCARGDGNACVNAGASIKNTSWPGGKPPAASRANCQFQTYKRMCDDRHPWGCFMTAQEYRRTGAVVAKSDRQFEAYMRRACAISKTSGACRDQFK